VLKEDGIKGLYKSYPITVAMNIPFASVVVCGNENFKTYIKPWEQNNPYLWYFLCAGLAGGMAGVLTNPLDVIKTRLQTQELVPSCPRLKELWESENNKRILEHQTELQKKRDGGKCCEGNANGGKSHSANCGFEVKHTRYADIKTTARYIYRNEGLIAFTKGVLPRMSINVPSTALSWGTYEFVKSLLSEEKESSQD